MEGDKKSYDHKAIEAKWQERWATDGTYTTSNSTDKPKMYVLDMFPYPSGAGLHVGHPRGYIGSDVFARFKRMQGFNVLHPMGYDAFGLPAEQYAVTHNVHPREAVERNVATFESQLQKIGLSYDWSRKVNTTDPEYYKWTQWIFLQLYNAWYNPATNKTESIDTCIEKLSKEDPKWHQYSAKEKQDLLMQYRIAYEGYAEVNWCPELGTVLANDEIITAPDGSMVSERGEYPVFKKSMRQWFMRISAYADRLLAGLDTIDWPHGIKEIQRNWIGKSEGSEINFKLSTGDAVSVFTTRADTLFGVTYVVLAPEHTLVQKLLEHVSNKADVERYIATVKTTSDDDRTNDKNEKTGICLEGITATNPANGEHVPVWIANYVLANYGTGAVMAVPAHDERDFEFAKKYQLEVKQVIAPLRYDPKNPFVKEWPIVERHMVQAIVKNPKDDRYLLLQWKELPWITFPGGGLEENESIENSALREIEEETGLVNLKHIATLPVVRSEYSANHKQQNRISYCYGCVFEVTDQTTTKEIADSELKQHEVIWRKESDFSEEFVCSEWDVWKKALHNNYSVSLTEEGALVHSGEFNGLTSEEARTKITEFVKGKIVTKYKMRDAIFARQRYWGEPIPLKYDSEGIITPLSEAQLPLTLPDLTDFAPAGDGGAPLSKSVEWVSEGYETNTMPGWAGSSWYFLRYMDPHNDAAFASAEAVKYWGQVDMYVGGAEHATGHLLYSRFWNMALHDLGYVPHAEPFAALRNQGLIAGPDGRKMSKRWGNVINPDDVVKQLGADTLRVYESFMGPFEAHLPWSTDGIVGSRRFIERMYRNLTSDKVGATTDPAFLKVLHKTIKKVTDDIQSFSFNTAISSLMICSNAFEKATTVSSADAKVFLQLLAPFAPHMTEELWYALGETSSIHFAPWPTYDAAMLVDDVVTIGVQVNGKVRADITLANDMTKEDIEKAVMELPRIKEYTDGKKIKNIIIVPGRIINIVLE